MGRIKWHTVLIAMLSALLLVGAVTTASAAKKKNKKAPTTVTIKAQGEDLSGVVKSKKTKCKKKRTVIVYRQKTKRQDPRKDQKIASDITDKINGKYRWSTGNTGMYGNLYAQAAKKKGCKVATSKTVRVLPK